MTIIQSPSQLREVYGPDAAANYMTNHAVEVVFTPKEHSIAKELSERFGFSTVSGHSFSKSAGLSKSSKSETTSDQRRALMLPQELVLTPYENQYLLKGGMRPVKAKKIIYYNDPLFKKRILPPPVVEPMPRKNALLGEVLGIVRREPDRQPTTEEITAPALPADGEDGFIWTIPNDLATAFEGVEISDDSELNQNTAEAKVLQWLDMIASDVERAA